MNFRFIYWRPNKRLIDIVKSFQNFNKCAVIAPVGFHTADMSLIAAINWFQENHNIRTVIITPDDYTLRYLYMFFRRNSNINVSVANGWSERSWNGNLVIANIHALIDDNMFDSFDHFIVINSELFNIIDNEDIITNLDNILAFFLRPIPSIDKYGFDVIQDLNVGLSNIFGSQPKFYFVETPFDSNLFKNYINLREILKPLKGTEKGNILSRIIKAFSEEGPVSIFSKDSYVDFLNRIVPNIFDELLSYKEYSHKSRIIERVISLHKDDRIVILSRTNEFAEFIEFNLLRKNIDSFDVFSIYDKFNIREYDVIISTYLTPKLFEALNNSKKHNLDSSIYLLVTPMTNEHSKSLQELRSLYPKMKKRTELSDFSIIAKQLGLFTLEDIKRYLDIGVSLIQKYLKKMIDDYKIIELWGINYVELERWVIARDLERKKNSNANWILNPSKSPFQVFVKKFVSSELGKDILNLDEVKHAKNIVISVNAGRLQGTWRELYKKVRGNVKLSYETDDLIVVLDYKVRNKVEAYLALKNFDSIVSQIVEKVKITPSKEEEMILEK